MKSVNRELTVHINMIYIINIMEVDMNDEAVYGEGFVDELISRLELAEEAYLEMMKVNIPKMLKSDKNNYKLFGVYWWGVKDFLRRCVHDNEWYCGSIENQLVMERANHGSDFRNLVAAMHFAHNNINRLNRAEYYDKDENYHDDLLLDENAGC